MLAFRPPASASRGELTLQKQSENNRDLARHTLHLTLFSLLQAYFFLSIMFK